MSELKQVSASVPVIKPRDESKLKQGNSPRKQKRERPAHQEPVPEPDKAHKVDEFI